MKHFNYASQSTGDNLNGLPLFQKDICERKHGGNKESHTAFENMKDRLTEKQARVFDEILLQGTRGATVDEIAQWLHTTPNAISGRVSELHHKKHKIVKIGTRLTRNNVPAAVWKAVCV